MESEGTSAKRRLFISRAPVDPIRRTGCTPHGAQQPAQRKSIRFSEVPETKRDLAWLAFFGVIFFVGSLILPAASHLYSSPDENANAFFAQTFAEHGRLYAIEPLNAVLDDALYPRSVVAIDGRLLPGSFLGLPVLFGIGARLFGVAALPIFTPVIAVLAVFAWYGITRMLFDRRVARLAALLLFAHPAWWYYASRGLMHNVLFTSLLIFTAFFLLVRPFEKWKKGQLDIFCSGLMLGLALFVRTSEAIWIGLILFLIIIFYWRKLHCSKPIVPLFLCSLALALSPMFFLNRSLYSSPLSTGYTVKDEAEQVVFAHGDEDIPATVSTEFVKRFVAPFGIEPRTAWTHVRLYGLKMFWWMFVLAGFGVILAWPRRSDKGDRRRARFAYLASFVLISAWLALIYGSWTIHDNPDPTAVTIGQSYVRYWLPVFVMTTPLAALAFVWICERPFTRWAQRFLSTALFLFIFALGIYTTFFSSDDALVPMAKRSQDLSEVQARVFAQTESDAVIIVDRADKLFFPDRRVLYPLRTPDDRTYQLIPRMLLRAPLYYFGITLPAADVEYLNTDKLKNLGAQIEHLETFSEESLYRISPSP